MEAVISMLLYLILILILAFAGALDIASAIERFIEGAYFKCGFNIMLAAWMMACIFRVVFVFLD